MNMFFLRKINIKGRYPFVRLIQFWNNPKSIYIWIVKNLYYKRSKKDYTDKYKDYIFLSPEETLNELIVNGKSLARFNDGEFDQLVGIGEYPPDSDWSQRYSLKLKTDMIKVLTSNSNNLCVAITPAKFFLAKKDNDLNEPFDFNMWVYTKTFLYKYLNNNQSYGDCRLFVPYCSPNLDWNALTQYLQSKTIIIATGDISSLKDVKLGKSNYYVECGKVDAYERRYQIKDSIDNIIRYNHLKKQDIIILASLGPTAGILALEYSLEDITVWDTGHMFKHAQSKLK